MGRAAAEFDLTHDRVAWKLRDVLLTMSAFVVLDAATVAVVLTRAGSPLRQWLLSVTIAIGVIAMHHVVAGPAGMSVMDHGAAPASTMAPVTNSVLAAPAGTASDPGCLDCGAMMGHMCLAVLVAVATLIVTLVLLAIAPSVRSLLLPVTPGHATLPARAPPDSGVRLSQLGVLRN